MRYKDIRPARFLVRPNRFIALVWQDGALVRAHVKNTGRCAELLRPGVRVWLEYSDNPERSTPCDLVCVEKRLAEGERRPGSIRAEALPSVSCCDAAGQVWQAPALQEAWALLINMDSAAPNAAAGEWLAAGGLGGLQELRAEVTVGDSRFDFCALQQGRPVAVEVKGCTLEADGHARFPDAPTQRGLRHVHGLTALAQQGWRACVLIVVQMQGIHTFSPNWMTHAAFGEALNAAARAGVEIHAVDCLVTPQELRICSPVPVDLTPPAGDGEPFCHI